MSLDPAYGGPARCVPGLALAQAELGHEVTLWSHGGIPADLCRRIGGHIRLGSGMRRLPEQLRGQHLVHDHGIWHPYHHRVARACREAGLPRVVTAHGMLEPWSLAQKQLKKRVAWALYQQRDLAGAAALHATAPAEEAQLRRLGFGQKIIRLPNGIEFGGFPVGAAVAGTSPPSRQPVALFLSRIHPKKGLPLLIDAWAAVRPEGWRMQVVGPGEPSYIARLQAMLAEAGLGDAWEFHRAVDDGRKWDLLAAASLLILPSYSENFGIVVAEALATGVPVITTTATPWSGLLERKCGWWVEADVAALGRALREATAVDSGERKAMGLRGRAWALEEFTWPGIAGRMLQHYRELVGG